MKSNIKKRIAVVALLALPFAAAGTAAEASNDSWYTGHSTCSGCSGHRAVVYEGSACGCSGSHYHKYKHDVKWGSDHHPWKRIW